MNDDLLPAKREPPQGRRGRRLRWLAVAGAAVVVMAIFYVHFFLYLPTGSGPAGPRVERSKFEQPWTERPVLLVGLGDSVTAGFGASKGRSYFERLVGNPADEFAELKDVCLGRVLPNLKAMNLAMSGSNSLQHVGHIRDRLPVQDENVFGLIVMTTGGNDLIHWYGTAPPREGAMYGATLRQAQPWIDSYEARLDAMFMAM
jgi:hypothetical protein